jgi:nucleoside-triphosphatase THEP1
MDKENIDFTIGEHHYQILTDPFGPDVLIIDEVGYDLEPEVPELYALVREVARLRKEA